MLTAAVVMSGCAATGPSAGAPSATGAAPALTPVSTVVSVTAAPATQAPRTKRWIDLGVGDCLADLPPTDPSVVDVTVVDCAGAHAAEVYLRAPLAVNEAVADVADRDCAAGFAPYTGRAIDGSSFAVTYLIDSDQDRTSADPAPSTVICVLHDANGQPLTQSAHH